jgi:hypothetical protein
MVMVAQEPHHLFLEYLLLMLVVGAGVDTQAVMLAGMAVLVVEVMHDSLQRQEQPIRVVVEVVLLAMLVVTREQQVALALSS